MTKEFFDRLVQEHLICKTCPTPSEVASFFKRVMGFFYLDFATKELTTRESLSEELDLLKVEFETLLQRNPMNAILGTAQICTSFFSELPSIYDQLNKDIMAIYEGDPACKSRREVIRTYPGFYAIAAYRIAHVMNALGIEDLPRIITEHAHSQTGIDIHPGAHIGKAFCIDHGTGIVIGETAHIGDHVKLYQGVTLGALSVAKEDANKKRHPTIEDHCVIYANATILGGETVIGHHTIIGGNTWITRSVPPNSKIYYQATMNNPDGGIDNIVYKKFSN
ncbi:MAG: serine O-acetyltransferase [Bacteroidota bacterium]